MMVSFAGKTAVVTGGGSGIGQAVVKRFAEFGAHVVVLDISEAAAQESVDLVKAAGGRARAFQLRDPRLRFLERRDGAPQRDADRISHGRPFYRFTSAWRASRDACVFRCEWP